jgi:hypothetical protein
VHTDLLNPANEVVGYRLRCCGCGRNEEFLLDHENNGYNEPYKNDLNLHKGDEFCIRLNYCPRKDCKLYNKHFHENEHRNEDPYKQHSKDSGKIEVEVLHKPHFL